MAGRRAKSAKSVHRRDRRSWCGGGPRVEI